MKTTRKPFGSECISTGKGNAFSAAGAGAAEAATSAARNGTIMNPPGARIVADTSAKSRKEILRLKTESALQFGAVGVGCPEGETVLARGLRLVHGAVGPVEELFGSVGRGFEPRHSDGSAEVQPGVAVAECAGAREEAVRERLDGGALRLGEEDGEFVAAQPRRHVAGADGLADRMCDLPEELVALDVALLVVQPLEVVDVDVGDADRRSGSFCVRQLRAETLDEGAPLRQARARGGARV